MENGFTTSRRIRRIDKSSLSLTIRKLILPMAFPTTRWTLLADATLHGDVAGRAALAKLCEKYHRPVLMFLAAQGFSTHEQEDLAQEFFLRWLKSRAWKRADRVRGKFRNFMLGAVRHMIAHEAEKNAALKRGGGAAVVRLDDADFDLELPAADSGAVHAFDRGWALALISNTISALRAEHGARGKAAEFEVLRQFLPGSEVPPSLEDAAARMGLGLTACKSALHRLRERFRELLRAEVARTVSAPHEIEEELQYLRTLLLELPPARILESESRKER